jgi:hypothetical protein
MVGGTRWRVREGAAPPAGGSGAWPPGKDVENMHFEAMFRQYLFISSLHIWNRNVNYNLSF